MDDATLAKLSRRLRARCDAILAAVFFMPEAHQGYPGIDLPGDAATLASRAACMGPVPGRVAAAAFAPLYAPGVTAAVDRAWTVTDPQTLLAARLQAATTFLASLMGDEPEGIERAVALLRPVAEAATVAGHPTYAGLRSLDWPDPPLGQLWRACDMVREHRGDSHVNAFLAAGVDPIEMHLLSELWRGAALFSIGVAQAGWPRQEADAALDRVRARGLVEGTGADDAQLTPQGKELRDEIEQATDRQERELVEALGNDADELLGLLDPWARAVSAVAAPWWKERGVPSGHP